MTHRSSARTAIPPYRQALATAATRAGRTAPKAGPCVGRTEKGLRNTESAAVFLLAPRDTTRSVARVTSNQMGAGPRRPPSAVKQPAPIRQGDCLDGDSESTVKRSDLASRGSAGASPSGPSKVLARRWVFRRSLPVARSLRIGQNGQARAEPRISAESGGRRASLRRVAMSIATSASLYQEQVRQTSSRETIDRCLDDLAEAKGPWHERRWRNASGWPGPVSMAQWRSPIVGSPRPAAQRTSRSARRSKAKKPPPARWPRFATCGLLIRSLEDVQRTRPAPTARPHRHRCRTASSACKFCPRAACSTRCSFRAFAPTCGCNRA